MNARLTALGLITVFALVGFGRHAVAGSDIGDFNPCSQCSNASISITPTRPRAGESFEVDLDFTATLACQNGSLIFSAALLPELVMLVRPDCVNATQPSRYHYHGTIGGQPAGRYDVIGALGVDTGFIPFQLGVAGTSVTVVSSDPVAAPAAGTAGLATLIMALAAISLYRQRRLAIRTGR